MTSPDRRPDNDADTHHRHDAHQRDPAPPPPGAQEGITPEVEELIHAAMSDRLTGSEQQRLEALLRDDDQALTAYLEYCQLETDLHFQVRAALAGRRAIRDLRLEPAAPATAADRPGRPRAQSTRWTLRGLSVLAAMLLLGATGWWISVHWGEIHAERQPRPIACLTEQQEASWLGGMAPAVGHSFVEGDSVYLTQGRARISMSSGVEMMLRGPCFVTLAATDRVQLEEGVVTAQVAEWGRGFTISTEAMQVTDLGTRFAVSSSADGDAEAHVIDGQVRVRPVSASMADRRTLLLLDGEGFRVESGRRLATRIEANKAFFDAPMGSEPPFKPIPVFNTGVALEPGDEDPHWKVTAGPAGQHHQKPAFAVVCNADSRYLANDAGRSQWISLSNPVRPGVPPNTTFTFETTFDLAGYNLSTVIVAAQVIADNGIAEVRLNGNPVDVPPWLLNERDQLFNRFVVIEFRDGFVPGINRVEFDVWNGVDRYAPEVENPLALRVEWQAFGRPTEPQVAEAPSPWQPLDGPPWALWRPPAHQPGAGQRPTTTLPLPSNNNRLFPHGRTTSS